MSGARTALIISPHADDAAAFCGGILLAWAREGWRLILVRVTDDARDSVGLDLEETVARNRNELAEAAERLGIAEIVELGFPTDTLADVPLTRLRERIVYCIRKYQPYAVFGFDPDATGEPNQDHVRVAQATEEAYWVATFDLHHPEHFAEGLAPFAVCEHWYFARQPPAVNALVDITDHIAAKAAALATHRTMVRNILEGIRLQLRTFGRQWPALEQAQQGDPTPLLEQSLTLQAAAVAQAGGLPEGRLAEAFRVTRFGDLEDFVRAATEPLPGTPPPVPRPFLGDTP